MKQQTTKRRKKARVEKFIPLYDSIKCSCGRIPIGLTKEGILVCKEHDSFPTKKTKELDWSKVPKRTFIVYAPNCPYCANAFCNADCIDIK